MDATPRGLLVCFLGLPDDHIWDRLDLKTLLALSQTSSRLKLFGEAYLMHRFECLLYKITSDTLSLREIMRTTSSFISGSSALFFMCPSDHWPSAPDDIDFYVSYASAHKLLFYLCGVAGFRQTDILDSSYWNYRNQGHPNNIKAVVKLRHERTGVNVDVIASIDSNPLALVGEFDFTCVMNFISSDHIVCLYPNLTFNGITHVLQCDQSAKRRARREKYKSRGYELRNPPPPGPDDRLEISAYEEIPGLPFEVQQPVLIWCARDTPE